MNKSVLPRLAASAMRERLRVMPAVVITGPRQAGKSTLVQRGVPGRRVYVTLDDMDALGLARRDVALPQPTVHRYFNVLETSYLLVRLPAFARNRTKRLTKSPKLYWGDTGVAIHVSGATKPEGAHLENLMLGDLLAWRDASLASVDLHYWRTTTGTEVDFVVESGAQLLPIEVKASARPRLADAGGLIAFRQEYGTSCRAGLLLHCGRDVAWLAPGILAAPWWAVL